jgi:hypothetical protein
MFGLTRHRTKQHPIRLNFRIDFPKSTPRHTKQISWTLEEAFVRIHLGLIQTFVDYVLLFCRQKACRPITRFAFVA